MIVDGLYPAGFPGGIVLCKKRCGIKIVTMQCTKTLDERGKTWYPAVRRETNDFPKRNGGPDHETNAVLPAFEPDPAPHGLRTGSSSDRAADGGSYPSNDRGSCQAPTEAPTEEPTEALPEETEAPTEPPERPEHTVRIQVSDNCDYTVTNAEGQTTRQGDDGRPRGDLVVYSIDLYGFDTGTLPMEVWEVAASDSFTLETTTSPCAFCAEIGDAFYAVTECTGVTRIEFRDGYIKLSGSEMTYKILTTSHARERQYFCITGTGTTEIEFPIEDVLAASPIGETYRVERCTV